MYMFFFLHFFEFLLFYTLMKSDEMTHEVLAYPLVATRKHPKSKKFGPQTASKLASSRLLMWKWLSTILLIFNNNDQNAQGHNCLSECAKVEPFRELVLCNYSVWTGWYSPLCIIFFALFIEVWVICKLHVYEQDLYKSEKTLRVIYNSWCISGWLYRI